MWPASSAVGLKDGGLDATAPGPAEPVPVSALHRVKASTRTAGRLQVQLLCTAVRSFTRE